MQCINKYNFDIQCKPHRYVYIILEYLTAHEYMLQKHKGIAKAKWQWIKCFLLYSQFQATKSEHVKLRYFSLIIIIFRKDIFLDK
jgi:hypothetical protein